MKKQDPLLHFVWLLLVFSILFLLPGCSADSSSNKDRPNILLVVSDQQHYQAAGFMDKFFSTPNLDELARHSTVFTKAFVTSPQCSPSRSSLYTGLYPHKTGVIGNTGSIDANGKKIGQLDESLKTIGEYLKPAGYTTAYIGKWHLGEVGNHANGYDIGLFDTFRGGDSTTDEEKTRRALAFLDKFSHAQNRQPFALFLNYTEPHNIYRYGFAEEPEPIDDMQKNVQLPMSFYLERPAEKPAAQTQYMQADSGKHFFNKDEKVWRTYRGVYRSKVEKFDNELGKVLDALKSHGVLDDTIVIVTSDHGDMDTHHRLVFKGPFGYEQVIRVPLVIHVPERFGGRTPRHENAFTINVDILPTILDFAGLPWSHGDGTSLKPLLLDENKGDSRTLVIAQYYNKQKWVHPIRMARSNQYKFINHLTGTDEFYDLAVDPGEIHNLINNKNYEVARKQLANLLDEWIGKQSDPFHDLVATDRDGKPVAHP